MENKETVEYIPIKGVRHLWKKVGSDSIYNVKWKNDRRSNVACVKVSDDNFEDVGVITFKTISYIVGDQLNYNQLKEKVIEQGEKIERLEKTINEMKEYFEAWNSFDKTQIDQQERKQKKLKEDV